MDAWTLEGTTRLAAPSTNMDRPVGGPGARTKGAPFFNPGMALNRDLSVLIVAAEARRKGRILEIGDALAGTGARSVRLAHEIPESILVHANDAMPQAVAAMRRNARENHVPLREPSEREQGGMAIHEGDAHRFLASRRFDIVDLDPCGSPMPFLDAAVRATREGGLVCVTATDTGALCGKYQAACRRRYDAHHGLHATPWRAEVGLRILAGAVVRSAARQERAAQPVLMVAKGHWMRVVARVSTSSTGADRALSQLASAVADAHGFGTFGSPSSQPWAGPLWAGPLHDAALVAELARGPTTVGQGARDLLVLLQQEAEAPPFWMVPDLLQKRLGPPPRRDVLMQELRDAGFPSARTHLDPQGIRTTAKLADLAGVWIRPKGAPSP